MQDRLPVTSRKLFPTDIAQFLRLAKCERYLRLRLHEHSSTRRFMEEYDVRGQAIPPLLTRSGRRFESRIERAVRAAFDHLSFAESPTLREGKRSSDIGRMVEHVRALAPGQVWVACQPRLEADLGRWALVGDADLIRFGRDAAGRLSALVADVKSSREVKVEHRLQVAFYRAMLSQAFAAAGLTVERIDLGIVYRGSPSADDPDGEIARARDAAEQWFGARDGLLDLVPEPERYDASVEELVTAEDSTAARIASTRFDRLPYQLGPKCDGCLYTEFCMKDTFERDDLSLIPYLAGRDKKALQRAGIRSAAELAAVKEYRADAGPGHLSDLDPAPGCEAIVRRLASTPVGPRLDELVLRARRTPEARKAGFRSPGTLPSKGHSSLPHCDAAMHPNLVTVYLDAQHDHLNDRIYMIGARIVACEGGAAARSRNVVHLTSAPPDTAEAEQRLFAAWIRETLRAVVELAAPDARGERYAPIHLVFWDAVEQKTMLEGLARTMHPMIAAAPALYDFVTQMPAFDSTVATFLDTEIRERRNFPLVCPSLQAVAEYLGFDWDEPEPYRTRFRERLFDGRSKLGETYYASRARYSSQIPLEYACAAWGDLDPPPADREDPYAPYRAATAEGLERFQARRLEALEWIADRLDKNRLSQKSSFQLPDLDRFEEIARHLAQALHEFLMIERHESLAAWKSVRQFPAERRVPMGETLIARYLEADQDPAADAMNRENVRRARLRAEFELEYLRAHPDAAKPDLTPAQKAECKWSQDGLVFRLRLSLEGVDCDLETALSMTTIRSGDSVVVYPRLTVDGRLPPEEQTQNSPTPKQMLYGTRARIAAIHVEKESGQTVAAIVEIVMDGSSGSSTPKGFYFGAWAEPFESGGLYTVDRDPNDFMGYHCVKVAEGLCAIEAGTMGGRNTLYDRLSARDVAPLARTAAEDAAQARFLEGLDALRAEGLLHDWEESKREYIGGHGGDPVLLVQGPPGTGKSYATAFAVLARMQGALAAGRPMRVLLSCKTHAATDVLLAAVRDAIERLRALRGAHGELWDRFFDGRLMEIPLLRLSPKRTQPEGVVVIPKDDEREKGSPRAGDRLRERSYCIAAATPGGIRAMVKALCRRNDELFTHAFCELLVIDEASQINLPEAIMAALPLDPAGRMIVVGDPRQMPPIIQHDWANEPRRTFQQFRSYESLFTALLALDPPVIRFGESFRLHAAMAEFLRQEIYRHDGIAFHSHRREALPPYPHADPYVAAVLDPAYPLVAIVHDEEESQTFNAFERALAVPIVKVLADPSLYGLDARDGLGVVVPHRAQRAALKAEVPELTIIHPGTGAVAHEGVDTVERFQGAERQVILVSATESDREYLEISGDFLLNPQRLNVALSRGKTKMILIASRSIFTFFSSDEELFQHSQIWKNLLRRTCTEPLWRGERDGHAVTVWGGHCGADS